MFPGSRQRNAFDLNAATDKRLANVSETLRRKQLFDIQGAPLLKWRLEFHVTRKMPPWRGIFRVKVIPKDQQDPILFTVLKHDSNRSPFRASRQHRPLRRTQLQTGAVYHLLESTVHYQRQTQFWAESGPNILLLLQLVFQRTTPAPHFSTDSESSRAHVNWIPSHGVL